MDRIDFVKNFMKSKCIVCGSFQEQTKGNTFKCNNKDCKSKDCEDNLSF
jgi:hypothetical protein